MNVQKKINFSYVNPDGITSNQNNYEAVDFSDANLLWNFNDSTSANGFTGLINLQKAWQGTILATGATLKGTSNIDGSIIVNEFLGAGETHCWDYQETTDPGNDEETPQKSNGSTTDSRTSNNKSSNNYDSKTKMDKVIFKLDAGSTQNALPQPGEDNSSSVTLAV